MDRLIGTGNRVIVYDNFDEYYMGKEKNVQRIIVTKLNVLVVCPSDPRNKGTLSVLIAILQELEEMFSDHTITFLTESYEKDFEKYRVRAVQHLVPRSPTSFRKIKTILSICRFTTWATLHRLFKIDVKWLLKPGEWETLQAYAKTDFIVACGTDALSDKYGVLPCMGTLYNIFLGILLKIPTCIISQQIGPFQKGIKGRICSFLTKIILGNAKLIATRDAISLQNLGEIGVKGPPIYLTADIAFLLRSAPYEEVKQKLSLEGINLSSKPIIGINTSALIYHYMPGTSNEQKRKKYVRLMSQITDYIIEEFGATVVFLPHVFGPPDDDRIIANEIACESKNKGKLKLINCELTCGELKGTIGRFDLFITTRMHPLIHAISMNVPVICVDYTFKAKALMQRINLQEQVCDISDLDFEKLKTKVRDTYSAKDRLKQKLSEGAMAMKEQARLNLALIESEFGMRILDNERRTMKEYS